MGLKEIGLAIERKDSSEGKKFYGKYRAIVTNTNDPDKMGRLKVKCPKVLGDDESQWCNPCFPPGYIVMPKVGDAVWVEFEEGDPARPIWTGVWYGLHEMPYEVYEKVGYHHFIINGATRIYFNEENRTVSFDGQGSVLINSNLTVNGDIQDYGTVSATGSVTAGGSMSAGGSVTAGGGITGQSVTSRSYVNASSSVTANSISANTGNISGSLSAGSASITGTVSANTVSSDTVSATSVQSDTITASSGAIDDTLNVTTITSQGSINTISVSAMIGEFSGSLSAGSVDVEGDITAGGNITASGEVKGSNI